MKDFYIADAPRFENQVVTAYFCLASLSKRERKGGGEPYLALTLADKTGQFDGRMWEDYASVVEHCSDGCYVKVQGQVSKYNGKFQITITKMRHAADTEVDPADFVPTTQYDVPAMVDELRGYVSGFSNPHLQRLVFAFLDDPAIGPAFVAAPAAKRLHHAWIGGLLEHVLHLVRVCRATAPFYPEVDVDLLTTGAILHDIGKVRELSWRTSFEYTLEGQLIGHISIAQGMLHEKIAQLNAEATEAAASSQHSSAPTPAFEDDHAERSSSGLQPAETATVSKGASAPQPAPETFPDKLRVLLEHMVLAHHGKLEFGSPKLPMTPEAMLLSVLDDLEAKFQTLRNAFAAASAEGRSPAQVTDWIKSMERPLFNSQRWLDEPDSVAKTETP